MLVGVVAIPERAPHVEQLLYRLEPHARKVQLFWDSQHKGTWWNQTRAMQLLKQAEPGEPVMITTDDGVCPEDWFERWQAIHAKAQDSIYSLYCGSSAVFTDEAVERGYNTGLHRNGFYDVAMIFIDQPNFLDDAKRWLFMDGGLHDKWLHHRHIVKKDGSYQHLDYVMEGFLLSQNRPWTVTTPTLFDHAQLKSTMGHGFFESPNYIGKPHTFESRST